MGSETKFEVDGFAFIGRTFEEYLQMFDLEPSTIEGKSVLDCPSGADSFVATAHRRGASVTGVDVMYEQSRSALQRRCRRDYEVVMDQLSSKEELFNWEFYGDLSGRKRLLKEAYTTFIDDYTEGRREGRYVTAALPDLPFKSDSFSLVLSAHFLFLYSDRLSYDFHLASLRELARVAKEEVRVFPLTGLDTKEYGRLDDLAAELSADGHEVDFVEVPFEFQRGADEMFVLSPQG